MRGGCAAAPPVGHKQLTEAAAVFRLCASLLPVEVFSVASAEKNQEAKETAEFPGVFTSALRGRGRGDAPFFVAVLFRSC